MSNPARRPIAISSISVVLALSGFMWQIHRARFNQSVDLLFRLENDFFGPAKKMQRVKASRDLLQGEILEAEPILDFFETMALLLRRGALDEEIVWHTFFCWIDPIVWQDLKPFVERLRVIQRKRLGARKYTAPTSEEIADFLAEEQTEVV